MTHTSRSRRALAALPLFLLLSGCTRAPIIDMDGSFLPAWMLCALVGVSLTGALHWQLVQRRLQPKVMPVVVFYPSVAVATSCLVWLLFFC